MHNFKRHSFKEDIQPPLDDSKTFFDEQKIWNSFLLGDEAAFIKIYKRYFNDCINYGLQFFEGDKIVEDFVQDLFIELRLKRKKFGPLRHSIKVLLFVSLKNKIIDYKRKQKVKNKNLAAYFAEFDFVMPIEENIIRSQAYREKVNKLSTALEKLTSRQREAIYYLYYEKLSYEEIKKMMNLDQVKSARNLIYKAVKMLKDLLVTFVFYASL
ncbi:MAG: sigma-70 family RNA polymerase sigma factor [Cytophagales bacterium]|nr:sigma-70 family RNA polymerase sigma factor [Cytophagales bacterium]